MRWNSRASQAGQDRTGQRRWQDSRTTGQCRRQTAGSRQLAAGELEDEAGSWQPCEWRPLETTSGRQMHLSRKCCTKDERTNGREWGRGRERGHGHDLGILKRFHSLPFKSSVWLARNSLSTRDLKPRKMAKQLRAQRIILPQRSNLFARNFKPKERKFAEKLFNII